MAVEKGKVKAALDAKFKGKSVSKELKESLASRWAEKIEDEAGIDAYITEREDDVLDAAKEADRRATTAAAKARQDAADAAAGKKADDKQDAPNEPVIADDAPAWAKALLEQNKQLTATVAGLQAANTQQTIAQRLKSDARTKDIPDWYLKGKPLPDANAFDAWADEQKADFTAVATEFKLQGYEGGKPPAVAVGGTNGKTKEATNEELDGLMSTMNLKLK